MRCLWMRRVVAVVLPLLLWLDGSRAQNKGSRVIQLGNPLNASTLGVDTLPEPGAIFLIHNVNLEEGVVFAFSAFFRSDSPVRLQIWRPVSKDVLSNATSQPFTLIFELKVIPSIVNHREDIYIESRIVKRCIRVQKDDRLGVYLEKSPSAVAYAFDKNQPAALIYTYKKDDVVTKLSEIVDFDLLKFPFDFSLTAYIDTDLKGYSNKTDQPCPLGLLIPEELRPSLPTIVPPAKQDNSIPGATGAPGMRGGIGSIGDPGRAGNPGVRGVPGKKGPQGPGGMNGRLGPQGPAGLPGKEGVPGMVGVRGPPGYSGQPGPVGPPGVQGRDEDPDHAATAIAAAAAKRPDRVKVIVITVWLIIVSLLVVVVVVVLILVKRRDRREYRERLPSAGPDFKSSWMDVLEEPEYDWGTTGKAPKTPEVIPDNLPTYAFDNDAMAY